MSAAPFLRSREEEVVEVRPERVISSSTARVHRVVARPVRQPWVRTLDRIVTTCLAFAIVTGMSWGFSTLLGHSMMESARREHGQALERAKVARRELARLRTRADRLSSMGELEQWARSAGFVPPAAPSTQLAANDAQDSQL